MCAVIVVVAVDFPKVWGPNSNKYSLNRLSTTVYEMENVILLVKLSETGQALLIVLVTCSPKWSILGVVTLVIITKFIWGLPSKFLKISNQNKSNNLLLPMLE